VTPASSLDGAASAVYHRLSRTLPLVHWSLTVPTGVRGTRDFYKERYGLGDRLAVRLASLLSHKVDFTAAVIECLVNSAALQNALLRPNVLALAPALDTETLLGLLPPDAALPTPLVVAEHDGWRTVALEEELLAEPAVDADEPALPALAGRAEVMNPAEIADLFTRRDVAELELTLRTSADPGEKITAIRRLALSPAGEREKLALFAMALTDRDAHVRTEAAEALVPLGLDVEVAEDARALAEGNERQQRFAAQRVGSRIQSAGDTEMGVLLRIIAGALRYGPSLEIRRLLIQAVEGACRAVARDVGSTRSLVRVLLGQLRDAVVELGGEVRRVLQLLGREQRTEVCAALHEELANATDHRVRRLVIAVVVDLTENDAERTAAAALAADEFLASRDPAVECLHLTNVLARIGSDTVAAIATRLAAAPEPAQEAFARLLDTIATRRDTPEPLRARIGELLLKALTQGERAARMAVILSTATWDPAIAPDTRRGLAAALLATLQEYANPSILDAIEATVAKLGPPALAPLRATLVESERPDDRVSAARIAAALISTLGEDADGEAARTLDLALDLLDTDFPDRAELARSLGQMCASPAIGLDHIERVTATLRPRVVDRELTHAALDGLGRLCLSANAGQSLKVDLVAFFARLLERDLPDVISRDTQAGDEVVYDIGSEVSAYTEMAPALIAGLQNIAATTPGALRERALDALVQTWARLASGEIQLGPGNTDRLLKALEAIGILPDLTPRLRERVDNAILLREDYLPTVRVRAELLVAAGQDLSDRAAVLADTLLKRLVSDRQLTETERALILGTLVRLATGADLGPPADRLRERVVRITLDAGRRGLEAVPNLLAHLHDSPAITPELKKRIAPALR